MNKDKKKHDMRDEIPATVSVTNTDSRMAGGVDNPNVKVGNDNHTLKPGPVDSKVPEGQDTKSS